MDKGKRAKRHWHKGSESDEESGSQVPVNHGVRCTFEVSPLTAISGSVKDLVTPRFNSIDAAAEEIKRSIDEKHGETKYVYKKHSDQAHILARLNEELRAKDKKLDEKEAVIQTLNETIHGLHEEALADSTGLFEEIKDDIRALKKKMKDIYLKLDRLLAK
jgi:septal ring factor EnvC (AmiA/AmiB activator)